MNEDDVQVSATAEALAREAAAYLEGYSRPYDWAVDT